MSSIPTRAPSGAKSKRAEGGAQGEALPSMIWFEGGSTVVADEYRELIRRHAEDFRGNDASSIVLAAHACPGDSGEEAIALGMQRMHAVAAVLREFGIASHAIVCVTQGGAPCEGGADGAASSRRCVEIRHRRPSLPQSVWSSQRTRAKQR